VVDFVAGAINALDAQSERLGATTFLFAPADVLLSRSGGFRPDPKDTPLFS
ncbi:MAG: DUF552 domain-containing protein, partial [Cyanobacteria bacterium K_DeepCast_35m_m2_023]|nr:DUF552 domain-containing protein [Cyanobacteria bacterium K_DeepCast_35m_m2_023]